MVQSDTHNLFAYTKHEPRSNFSWQFQYSFMILKKTDKRENIAFVQFCILMKNKTKKESDEEDAENLVRLFHSM